MANASCWPPPPLDVGESSGDAAALSVSSPNDAEQLRHQPACAAGTGVPRACRVAFISA